MNLWLAASKKVKDRGISSQFNQEEKFIIPKTDHKLPTGITITPTIIKIGTTKEARKTLEILEIQTGDALMMIERKELTAAISEMNAPQKYKGSSDSNKESFLKEINFTSKDLEIMRNQKILDR